MPNILRGSWFSWEEGKPTQTDIDATSMTKRGVCVDMKQNGSDYTFIFKDKFKGCYTCIRAYPRTLNVFDKIDGSCVGLPSNEKPTFNTVCSENKPDQLLITLFNDNYVPINCRSSLEGVWQFAYQVICLRIKQLFIYYF